MHQIMATSSQTHSIQAFESDDEDEDEDRRAEEFEEACNSDSKTQGCPFPLTLCVRRRDKAGHQLE
jgi:hypothetical protein